MSGSLWRYDNIDNGEDDNDDDDDDYGDNYWFDADDCSVNGVFCPFFRILICCKR